MKHLMILMVTFQSFLGAGAQVSKVSLQASGLTCSMCSNAINKSLKTISTVESIEPNIKTSTFVISFKPGSAVDFDQLKKKVEDAGFFVSRLDATMQFDNVALADDAHVKVGGNNFHILNADQQTLTGSKTVRIIDKGFVSAKEYKKNSGLTKMDCYKTGVAATCCVKEGLPSGTRIFHVTI
ncbi:MAG: heavy-metal-associated domain-containing protein [Ferruginibacter sp.]|nr:heavy-metal-associated domain-containing protein [Ferruginibacter sp.]